MNEEFETAKKLADEFMEKTLAQDWSQTSDWIPDACKRMNELSPEACMVLVMRLTHLASCGEVAGIARDKNESKTALQKFNLAIAKHDDFVSAMKKLHEMKQSHAGAEWHKQLMQVATS